MRDGGLPCAAWGWESASDAGPREQPQEQRREQEQEQRREQEQERAASEQPQELA